MSLTLPSAFTTKTYIKENWLFQLYYDDGSSFLGLSFYDTTVSTNFYHGSIMNKPSIRESISLEDSTAKTSNVSLSIANFEYNNDDLSAELFGGTRKYINRDVKIYIQPDDDDTLSNCLLVYTGRLTDVSHKADKVNINIVAKRVWDNITVPTDKTTDNGIYVPISYGNYTENPASTFASPQFESALTSKAYRPVPFNKMDKKKALYVDGVSTTSSGELAVYEKGVDVFLPLANAEANNGSSVDGAFHDKTDLLQVRSFQQRADSIELVGTTGSTIVVSNESRAIDTDNTNYATYSVAFIAESTSATRTVDLGFGVASGKSDRNYITLKDANGDIVLLNEDLDSSETGVDIDDDEDILVNHVIKVDDEEMAVTGVSSDTLTVRRGFGSKKESHDNDEIVYYDQTLNAVAIKYQIVFSVNSGNNTIQIETKTDGDNLLLTKTSDVSANTLIRNITNGTDSIRLKVRFASSEDGGGPPTLVAEIRIYDVYLITQRVSETPEDILYVANDGLTDNGWNSNSAITEIHEAHRDLMHRHTSYTNSNTPTNWSSGLNINSVRDWQIRYWMLEPMPLIEVLEKLQFEGGFISRFNGQNEFIYIFIPDSPSADFTLTKDDIADIDLSVTPFSNIISKMEIEYEKHPAENRYISSVTATNSSTRTDYNIASAENIKKVELDANVSQPSTAPANASDKNDDFYRYYDHILGTPKIIVDTIVINPAYMGIDVGDILAFDSMNIDPFGESWSGKFFMVVSTQRSVGTLKITAREI